MLDSPHGYYLVDKRFKLDEHNIDVYNLLEIIFLSMKPKKIAQIFNELLEEGVIKKLIKIMEEFVQPKSELIRQVTTIITECQILQFLPVYQTLILVPNCTVDWYETGRRLHSKKILVMKKYVLKFVSQLEVKMFYRLLAERSMIF